MIDLGELIDEAWDRFVAKVHAPDPFGCWLWLGGTKRGGSRASNPAYGHFRVRPSGPSATFSAHGFACAAAGYEVPEGWTRDHTCGQHLCVNPLHIEVVTNAENVARAWVARRRRQPREAA